MLSFSLIKDQNLSHIPHKHIYIYILFKKNTSLLTSKNTVKCSTSSIFQVEYVAGWAIKPFPKSRIHQGDP